MSPTVSVLTPVYNAAAYLPQLVRSVAEQRGIPSLEHVLIDDGSTDQSLTALRELDWDGLRVHSRENRGQYRTHNELLDMASGEFVLFIAADDHLNSETALAGLLSTQRRGDKDVTVGRVRVVDDRYEGASYVPVPGPRLGYALLPVACAVQHCAVLVRRSTLLDRDIRFSEEYGYAADWDWLLQLRDALPRSRWGFTGDVVAVKRIHAGQVSRSEADAVLASRSRVLKRRGTSDRTNRAAKFLVETGSRIRLFVEHLRRRGVRQALRKVRRYLTRHR